MSVVTEEELALSKKEKLELIDKEIKELYEQCLQYKFSPSEIIECAKPVLEPVWEYESRRRLKWFAIFAAVVAVVVALMSYKPTYDFIHACLRIFVITVIPLDKLSEYYKTECLISNPYYDAWKFTTDRGCHICKEMKEIKRLSGVDPAEFADRYMLRNRPVIITDATADWPSMEKFSIAFLNELYHTREEVNSTDPCNIMSNYRLEPGQHRKLLQKAVQGKVKEFYAYWDNCNIKTTKFYRQFCPRPYFLPRMVEASDHTFLLVAKNFTAQKYKLYIPGHQVIWMAQIKGETPIRLTPPAECSECEFAVTIKEGEILIFTTDMWDAFYKPQAVTESIMFGGGGFFDM